MATAAAALVCRACALSPPRRQANEPTGALLAIIYVPATIIGQVHKLDRHFAGVLQRHVWYSTATFPPKGEHRDDTRSWDETDLPDAQGEEGYAEPPGLRGRMPLRPLLGPNW